ncbi:MAG: tetratricopeptide repeat protein [Phycisphaerae bacterium]
MIRFFQNDSRGGACSALFKTQARRLAHATPFYVLLLSLTCVSAGWADTVLLRSAESVRNVRIVGFKEGRIETLDTKNGQRQIFGYSEIALIRVDGQPDLNEAEKSFTVGQFDSAVRIYQKAQEKMRVKSSWPTIWIKVRLMNILAAQGQVQRVVETYIDLAKQIPDWVISVSPTRKDLKATQVQLELAARQLVQARDASNSGKVREALMKFYQKIDRGRQPPVARDLNVGKLEEKDLEKLDQPGTWLDTWAEEKIKVGGVDSALRVTQRLFSSAFRRNLPGVFYWQGRAQLAKGDYENAALSFMEIAVEFPSSDYSARALFYAAQTASESGHLDYARTLWQELIDNFSNSADYNVIQLAEQARDLLHEKE